MYRTAKYWSAVLCLCRPAPSKYLNGVLGTHKLQHIRIVLCNVRELFSFRKYRRDKYNVSLLPVPGTHKCTAYRNSSCTAASTIFRKEEMGYYESVCFCDFYSISEYSFFVLNQQKRPATSCVLYHLQTPAIQTHLPSKVLKSGFGCQSKRTRQKSGTIKMPTSTCCEKVGPIRGWNVICSSFANVHSVLV